MKFTKYLTMLVCLLASFSYAGQVNDDYDDTYDDIEIKNQGHDLDTDVFLSAYNSSSRIDVKGAWDVYLAGSYILWQIKQQGMEYAISYPANVNTDEVYPIYSDFDFQSGFKVIACTKFDHDGWMLVVNYTRLYMGNSKESLARDGGYLIPTKIYYNNRNEISQNCSYCRDAWHFDYDMVLLELKRPMYTGSHLTLTPHIGMKGGWMDQEEKETAIFTNLVRNRDEDIEGRSKSKAYSWFLGVRTGLDTNWLLGYGFKIVANAAASLGYQDFKTSFKQNDYDRDDYLYTNAKEKIGYITPNADLYLALGYGIYFDENKWYVDLQIGYEINYYFAQNTMRELSDKILRQVDTNPGDLMLHGLTVTARFDF